jgi:hypothetical protein
VSRFKLLLAARPFFRADAASRFRQVGNPAVFQRFAMNSGAVQNRHARFS